MTIEKARGQVVVAIGEDRRCDNQFLANDPAYGMTPAVDLRSDGFDDDAAATVIRFHDVHFWNVKLAVTILVAVNNQAEDSVYLEWVKTIGVITT
jgi:hypothetical protein